MLNTIIVAALAAIMAAVVSVLLTRLAARREVHDAQLELTSVRARAEGAEDSVAAAHAESLHASEALRSVRAENAALTQDSKWLKEEIDRHKAAVSDTQALIERADKKFKETFQSVAAEALNANRAAFLDLAKVSFEGFSRETALQSEARHKALDGLVKPIGEALQKVGLRLDDAEQKRLESYSRLTEQVASLGAATSQLSRALRTPAVRGRWGEMQLRRVVEIAGMLNRCDFEEQPSLPGDGGRLRPDLIVHLPGGKHIVVDAKAPLDAYLDAQEALSDDAHATQMRLHARHVREHMDGLGSKAYWQQLDHAPDLAGC